jgi:hypothetical protein
MHIVALILETQANLCFATCIQFEGILVIAEAFGYSNAPTRTCSGDFQVGFS